MAEEVGFTVDAEGFEEQMENQRERSRLAAQRQKQVGDGSPLILQAEQTAWLADQGFAPTQDDLKYEWDIETSATVQAIYNGEGFLSSEDKVARESGAVGIVLDSTPFYGEAGGQVADTGTLQLPGGAIFTVQDVQIFGAFILHIGTVARGSIRIAETVTASVDYARRRRIAPNHTGTHILNHALKRILGDHVSQKGSLVTDEKLRFDFSHKKAMTVEQLAEVEHLVQDYIATGHPVTTKVRQLLDPYLGQVRPRGAQQLRCMCIPGRCPGRCDSDIRAEGRLRRGLP